MNSMVRDGTNGLMVVNITALGKMIKCQDMASWFIQTAKNMKDHSSKTKSKGMVFSRGKMVDSMMECGQTENRMALQSISVPKEMSDLVYGKMVGESNG